MQISLNRIPGHVNIADFVLLGLSRLKLDSFRLASQACKSCDHVLGQDSSSQPIKARPEDAYQPPLNFCQEVPRDFKHDVKGGQLPACLLSALCTRKAIAGAYTCFDSID